MITPLEEKTAKLKEYAEQLQQHRGHSIVITRELIEFFEGVIELVERETFTYDELWTIYRALMFWNAPHTQELGEKVDAMARRRREEGV